jgi:hypothetical protein
MDLLKQAKCLTLAAALALAAAPAWAEDSSDPNDGSSSRGDETSFGSVRGLALGGDAGYYTYGMNDVNNRFNHGGTNDIAGGMGYGVAAKLGVTDRLAAKIGIDYLFASRNSTRTIGSTTYNTNVNMPATLLFLGGEYAVLPMRFLNLKIGAGYTLVNIYNGSENTTNGNNLDLGAITGSGSGFQAGVGAELFLGRTFSLEADLAYDYAKIYNATFAGSTADPGSTNRDGTVDYSGLVAKVGLNLYLFR